MRRQQGQGPPPGVVDDAALAVPEVVPRGHEEGQRALTHFGPQPPRRRLLPVDRDVDVDVARPPGPREEWGLFSSEPHLARDGRPVRDARAFFSKIHIYYLEESYCRLRTTAAPPRVLDS